MRRLRSKRSYKELDESLINLTPLIDVVFVVLIAFILVAPLLEVEQVQLSQAGPLSEKDISHKTKLTIYVKEDDTIWMNHRMVEPKELEEVCKQMKRKFPQHIPQIFHDKNAKFGTYQTVKNSLERSGFEKMDVILQSK